MMNMNANKADPFLRIMHNDDYIGLMSQCMNLMLQ